jgi:hypothetical protein
MPSGVLFIHNLRLVPLEQQTTRFRKALAQKAFALDTVGNFSIKIEKATHKVEKLHTGGARIWRKKQAGDKNSYIVEKLYTLG